MKDQHGPEDREANGGDEVSSALVDFFTTKGSVRLS